MEFLRTNRSFLTVLIPFLAIPWITFGHFHLFLFNFSHNRFEYFGFASEMSTSSMIVLLLVWMVSVALISALTMSRFYCGTLCPNTFFAHLLTLVTKKKNGWVQKISGFMLLVILSFVLAFSLIAYGVDTVELSFGLTSLSVSGWLVIFLTLLMTTEIFMIQGWYCAYLCPYGATCAILPIDDRLSYEFGDPANDCTECEGCVKICPIPNLDIRQGFDLRCIQCGLCEVACEKTFTKHPNITTLISHSKRPILQSAGRGSGYIFALLAIIVISISSTMYLMQEDRLENCLLENTSLHRSILEKL